MAEDADDRERRLEELRREIMLGVEQADKGMVSPLNDETIARIKERVRQRAISDDGHKQ